MSEQQFCTCRKCSGKFGAYWLGGAGIITDLCRVCLRKEQRALKAQQAKARAPVATKPPTAQEVALSAAALRPAHVRGTSVFSEEWYLVQQRAFTEHMFSLGYPPSNPKTEAMGASVELPAMGRGARF